MTKLQLLHRALNERMLAAVEQIMEMVGSTVLEYEEETTRVRKENEVLKRRLQWMERSDRTDWPGTLEPVTLSTQYQSNLSQEESVVSLEFGQEPQAVVIKTESIDQPVSEQGPVISEIRANADQTNSTSCDSTQSYMAPLEFDPTPSNRVRHLKGKKQRMSFACPDCGNVFGREATLKFHMRTHSAESPYACFYGDSIRKKKSHDLSKRSGENTDDHSDGSEQTNRSSPSFEHPGQEPDSESTKSDQTSSDKGAEIVTSRPGPLQCKQRQKIKIIRPVRRQISSRHGRRSLLPGVIVPDVCLNQVSLEKEEQLYLYSAGPDRRARPERFAALLFKTLIPHNIYQDWVGFVNYDGSKGKNALPNNLRQTITEIVGRKFQDLTSRDWKAVRDRLNELLRSKRLSFPII